MALIVQKFGGTSVGDIERIKKVATIIKNERDKGNQVVVVVSAMSGVTNDLVDLVAKFSASANDNERREYDSVVSTGESVSSALVALALMNLGLKSRSWQGWQIPIFTDGVHSQARIINIDSEKIHGSLAIEEIPVIAGFQGVFEDKVVTLGRGGSDTSAAAIAAAIGADRCDIYTDVDGIYSADPRIVDNPTRLEKISYSEMLEMASSGAKVLHPRSVQIAQKHKLKMRVLSSFKESNGTSLVNVEESSESLRVTGLSLIGGLASLELPLNSSNLLRIENLKKQQIVIRKILCKDKLLTLVFDRKDVPLLSSIFKSNCTDDLAKLTVSGYGLQNSIEVVEKIFKVSNNEGINIDMLSSTDTRIGIVIKDRHSHQLMKKLHSIFGLDSK